MFGIYLLKDTLLASREVVKYPLEKLKLRQKPLINFDDIVEYN